MTFSKANLIKRYCNIYFSINFPFCLDALLGVSSLRDFLTKLLCTFLVYFMHANSSPHLLRLDVNWTYGFFIFAPCIPTYVEFTHQQMHLY